MLKPKSFDRTGFNMVIWTISLTVAFFTFTFQNNIKAQTSSNIALKGTYATSVSDGVDVFSGSLEQVLPLINIQGRGEVRQSLHLPLRNPAWDVIETNSTQSSDRVYRYYRAVQRTDFHDHYVRGGYGILGKLEVETIYSNYFFAFSEVPTTTILKFTSNDGSIIKFRDALTDGQPLDARARGCDGLLYEDPNPPAACSRGRVFRAVDGSNVIFVADTDIYDIIQINPFTLQPNPRPINPSGTLILSNGTRIRIGNVPGTSFNNLTKMTDRNGNYLTFEYETEVGYSYGMLKKITDSLNREVTIDYGHATQTGYYDEIVYKGFGEVERRIRINYDAVENVMVPGQSLGTALFPGVTTRCSMLASGEPCDPGPGGPSGSSYAYSIKVPSSIVLPNGKAYSFYYNKYLEVARIKSPTGAYTDYSYGGFIGTQDDGFAPPSYGGGGGIFRRVSSVKNFDENGQLINEKTFSNVPQVAGLTTASSPVIDNVTIDVKDSGGTVLAKSKHYYYIDGGYSTWRYGKEYKTEILDLISQNILRKTETTWAQRAPFQWCAPAYPIGALFVCDNADDSDTPPPVDPRITEVKTTLETGQATKKTFSYDQYNNITDTYEFDYGVGAAGQFLRRRHTDYVTDSTYTSYTGSHLLRLPLHSWVSSDTDGINKTSFTQYEYDNYISDLNHAPLVSRSNVSGFDAAYDYGFTKRGNLTSATSFANAHNQSVPITTYTQYDIVGHVVKTIDAKGSASTVDYSDRFGSPSGEARGNWDTVSMPSQLAGKSTFAFATSATNSLGYTSYSQFDYSTGSVVDSEDINENVSTFYYDDVLDRQTQSILANNRADFRSQKTYVFDDINRTVTINSDMYTFGDNLAKAESFYNSLGQTTETRSYETGGYTVIKSEYDALGRVKKTSNPYRPYLNESPVWTETEDDSLGRTVKVKYADNSEVLTSYVGNTTTVTDQAGKQRRSSADALGQLTRIDEPNSQNDLGPIDSPTQATFYTYNTNGQMVKVTQGAQSRFFLYDSLGRLLRMRQPEQDTNPNLALSDPITGNSQWSTGSTYDANGNALTTTDVKGIVVTQTYDNLNRVLTRSYSDSTPSVTNTYDDPNVAFSKGQLTKVSSSISTTEHTGFDRLGRTLSHKQTTNGQSYTTSYTYNLSGALVEETYPSGRIVKNTFNNDAKLIEVSSKKVDQADFQIYANNFAYTATGALSQIRLGNGDWESVQFNSRLQVTQIGLGTSQNAVDLWKVKYDYGEVDAGGNLQTSKNSGNIARQTISFNGLSQAYVQTYKYDFLNRLSEATEINGATQTWKQNFGYDRYGNRTSFSQQKIGEQPITQTPLLDPANNQIMPGQGYAYDFNGNLTQDNQNRQFIFNGDNKQVEVRDASNITVGKYYYDGNGRRVKKVVGWVTTVFVYDVGGKLVAEYSTQQADTSTTSYLTSDILGSPRVITNSAGAVVLRRDLMPFGEELSADTANRTTALKFGHGNDNVRQRFTGYEKDIETGLDFAEARYYDNRSGRFTAVDPLLASGNSADPQSFNRYAYVANNPVISTDSTGMWSDHEWNTVSSGLFDDGPSVRFPIPYVEWGTTTTTTSGPSCAICNEFASPNVTSSLTRYGGPSAWPTETHNAIIADALPGLPDDFLKAVQYGSAHVDMWQGAIPITLIPSEAYKHSMVPGPWVKKYGLTEATERAKTAAENFTFEKFSEARASFTLAERGLIFFGDYRTKVREALFLFGMGIHPLMDGQSPAHKPWQVYSLSGKVALDVALLYIHKRIESRQPTTTEMHIMRDMIRSQFRCVVSPEFYDMATTPRKK